MSVLSTVVIVVGGIVAIAGFMISIYKIAKRIDLAVGVDSDGKTLSDRMSRVEHQLWENGGNSLKDQVNSIEACQIEIKAEMGIIKDILVGPLVKAKSNRKVRKAS
jgi:hypothetical protein